MYRMRSFSDLESFVARTYKKAVVIAFEFLNPHVKFAAHLSEERVLQLGVDDFVNSVRFEVNGGW